MSETDILGEVRGFLERHGIVEFSQIQKKGIPRVLRGENVLLLAPTGSGKTEAALLPLLYRLSKMKGREGGLFGFYIIYITPLRALNRDVFNRIKELCKHLNLTIDVRHGDTTKYLRRKQAITPPNILITTPESLQAILPGKRLKYHLRTVFAVVVDEVHELANGKRGTQLSLGLERLEKLVERPIQRIGLSATVGNPKEVAIFLGGIGRTVNIVWAGYESRRLDVRVESPIPSEEDIRISRRIRYPKHSTARLRRIMSLIEQYTTTIVFVNTRSFAEVLGSKISSMKPSFKFDIHHGSLSKESRMAAEKRLKEGHSRAIIATSSLELGIDIGSADFVIQYSSPRVVMRALQRMGRAGHGVRQTSRGVILTTYNLDDILESVVIIRRALSNKVERASIPLRPRDVLMHQICGVLLDIGEMEYSDLHDLIKRSYPYSKLSEAEFNDILRFMIDRGFIREEGTRFKMTGRTRVFYYENLSTIPDTRQIQVVDITTRSPIGVLDEDYVADNLDVGDVFVIRGRPWFVVSIENEEVICASASDSDSEAPRWIGEMIPVPYEVASEVADLWALYSDKDPSRLTTHLSSRYHISKDVYEFIIDSLDSCKSILGCFPSKKRLIVEDFGEGVVLHAPFGTRANETFGIILSALLTTRVGKDIGFERDPYRIVFIGEDMINPEHVVDIFNEYSTEQISEILRLAVKRTQTFASRFIHVGRRMGIIKRDAKIKEIPVRRIIQSFEGTPVFVETMREVLDEKLDEKRVISVFKGVHDGCINIRVVKTDTPSPFAKMVIEERTRFEVIGEITEEEEVLRLLEERILSKRIKLVCMGDGDWSSIRTLKTISHNVKCPLCGSKRIAVTFPNDSRLLKIVQMVRRGNLLSQEDEKRFKNADLVATLVANYGKQALIVMAGRGIGPKGASRILRPGLCRIDLLRLIAKAEREYARTRPFWN